MCLLECEWWLGRCSSLEAASASRSMFLERPFGLVLLLLLLLWPLWRYAARSLPMLGE